MKNYVQEGDRLTYTAGATITAGSGVLVGVKIGVASVDMVSGDVAPLAMEGVFNLPKLSTDVVAQGVLLYWDNTNKRITVTSAGNTLAGFAFEAAGNGVAAVNICINR